MLTMNKTKNEIINLINDANLSIEQIYYILKDLFEEVAQQYNLALQKETEEIEKEKKEEEKTDGENQEN